MLVVENVYNLDLSSIVLQVPSVINPFASTSTSWLPKSLERKKKRMIQLEAPNLDVIANLVRKGAKAKKTRIDSRLAVESYLKKLICLNFSTSHREGHI